MKTVKSALLGSKYLIDTNQEALLFQLKDLLKAHRELIVDRLINDMPTYLDYKFQAKPDAKLLMLVKDRLVELKKSHVDLLKYDSVVQQCLTKAVTHLTNEPFYAEIDEYVKPLVAPKQMKFV